MSTAFTDDPLARLVLASSACAAPAAPPWALAPERSAVTAPWPDAWAPDAGWLWADAVAAKSTAATATQSPPERCRIGIAMISSLVGPGVRPRAWRPFPRPKILSLRIVYLAPRVVNCRWAATRAVGHPWPRENLAARSTWNTVSRSSRLNHGHPARQTCRQSPDAVGLVHAGQGLRPGAASVLRGTCRARGSKRAAASGLASMTLTEPTIMRRPGIERSELETPELALTRGDHDSGQLIRFGDSNRLIHHGQEHLRVIRPVIGSPGSAQGLALRVARVARPCAAVVGPGLPRRADLPRSWHPVRTHEPR